MDRSLMLGTARRQGADGDHRPGDDEQEHGGGQRVNGGHAGHHRRGNSGNADYKRIDGRCNNANDAGGIDSAHDGAGRG